MTVDPDTQQQGDTASEAAATTPEPGASGDASGEAGGNGEQAAPKRGRQKGTTAKKTRTVQLTLTVTGTADGTWQAELKHGSTWVARGVDVSAAAVSRAANELHDELSGPIDEVITAAREQQQAKVAELEAELEQAKKALAELDT
ncbi:hypothetical protein SAMN06265360_11623 [Haloechinothrix alba]|uniref:Mucin n=1 Tax=Haloechinothrix alba TaxID=664784 RepID=A0A238YN98_9PSEU|nr:DUF6319 family protein [Haloechinothrix alba]SNR72278.1 hypothetical protein SAMN06265360_11623 [Haloechinothrix alba]